MLSSTEIHHRTLVKILRGNPVNHSLQPHELVFLDPSVISQSDTEGFSYLRDLTPPLFSHVVTDLMALGDAPYTKARKRLMELKDALSLYVRAKHPNTSPFEIESKVMTTIDFLCYNADLEQKARKNPELMTTQYVNDLWIMLSVSPTRKTFREAFPSYHPESRH